MNKLWENPGSKDLKITYPWITVELIPGTKKFYEVVWNCGWLSVAINSLEENKNPEMLNMVLKIFESVKEVNDQIILISDNDILNKQRNILTAILKEIFWEWNFRLIWIEENEKEYNSISWLQMNRTWFVNNLEVVKAIAELPNATVLSSIPKSDPRINEINKEIENFRNTIAGKSLQLLDLNSKKSNQIEIAWENIWYIAKAENKEELAEIFEKNSEKILVLKDDKWTAWWTSVNFIANKEQREAILKNEKVTFPVVIFEFLEPTFIENKDWKKFPIQFRPFLNNNMEIMGGTIKFSSLPVNPNLFAKGSWKSSFEKQNKALNTSSWVTNSIFLNEKWEAISSYVFIDRERQKLDKKQTQEFLSQFKLENSEKWLLLWEEVLKISENAIPELRKMQEKTNKTLDL